MDDKLDYVMAIDVAKGKSMFYILSIHGEVVLDTIEYEHTLSNFGLIDLKIREERIKQKLAVFMESTSIYHYPVMRYFLEQGYKVIVVNPNLVKKSSTTFRRTKTDRLDSIKIAETYFKEEIKSNAVKTGRLYDDLQAANRQLLSIEKALTAIKNRYTRLLDICIPEHEEFYTSKGDKYNKKYITLFQYLPHSEYIQRTRVDRITNILNLPFEWDYKKRLTKEAIKLKGISKNSYPGVSKHSNEVENLGQTISILKNLINHHEQAKQRLISLGKQSKEYKYINSIPGIGEQSASQVIAELGDISRFRNYKQINAYCGLEPSIYQSGKAFYNGHITKSGNGLARKVLYTTIMGIIKSSRSYYPEHPINVYYTKKKENKSTKESVVASSTKLIRIIFSLCKNETTFTR
jgi:transposase